MAPSTVSVSSCLVGLLVGLVAAQRPIGGEDNHPAIKTWRCSHANGCVEHMNYLVMDSLDHPVYQVEAGGGCGGWGDPPPEEACTTKEECAVNCVMEAVKDYSEYGIETNEDELTLYQLIDGELASPRIYLLDETKQKYEMMYLTGNEFTFDVDVSRLPCGMNSALYMSEMLEDGGLSDLNKGGANFGTGYCDAQCYTTPFINGEGNVEGYGSCCAEMDIWEANSRAVHIAPHPCNITQLYECAGDECDDNVCDGPGCAWNPYRVNQTDYYGRGSDDFQVDTTKPFTVITNFPANDDGKLVEIHRAYIQDGRLIRSEVVNNASLPQVNYMNDELCEATDSDKFMQFGAHEEMGNAMTRGMVLAISLWWDESGHMQWMDGAAEGAGPCDETEGAPDNILKVEPDPIVTLSNMKWGEIGSTWTANCQAPNKTQKLF